MPLANKQTNKLAFLLVCFLSAPNLLANEIIGNTRQKNENQAVILMYHHFGVDKNPSTNIRLAQFEAHIDYLSTAGYQIWPLMKIAEYIQNKKISQRHLNIYQFF